ncbi:MAG: iron ABC transporter permease [Rhodocyclaceae bacterium]|jgi:iron complex transport system permease protein|nr:iron ABC transporter permease [Rhodocyclaceae bacterium]MBK6908677.1 iron ABC transporter permease [Rhodocyclaceae bacterium]
MSTTRPTFSVLAIVTWLPLFSLALALATGSDGLSWSTTISALTGSGDPLQRDIILSLRLPRALAAFGCGALLALAGTVLQAILRNPLADPFVLGISSGSSALSLLAMLLGAGMLMTSLAGIVGALLSLAILFALAWQGGLLPTRLLLAGVILSSAWGAMITLMLALAPDAPLRGMVFWLMGDLAAASTTSALVVLAASVIALGSIWPLAQSLDAVGRGETMAASLGVRTTMLRLVCLLLASCATAIVVLTAGSIGFIGLIVPHLLRLAGVRRHRWLLPASAIGGGSLLILADLLARALVAPLQLPIGALTALLGTPLFLWLLTRTAQAR